MKRTLADIINGETVSVSDILSSDLRVKLLEMGLVKGKKLTVMFKAPFGDPIAVDVDGYLLSLRKNEAALIRVN